MPSRGKKLNQESYTAWHADVAAEYAYTDEAGNSRVMDLAVTYGVNGKIYTVDLTDPYNIHHYGPVKNADGTDLIILLRFQAKDSLDADERRKSGF